jgi:hypothetical protein
MIGAIVNAATLTKAKTIRKKPLKLFNLSHNFHKWLILFIGAQFVFGLLRVLI